MKLLPKILKPKFSYDLIRLGTNYDGGYLVEKSSILNSDFLLSFGISTNWDFEKDFINNNCVEYLAFDGSVNEDFWNRLIMSKFKRLSLSKALKFLIKKKQFYDFFNKKNFISKYIGTTYENSVTLDEILFKIEKKNIFLKIDIEGSEYDILQQILDNQSKILGLAIEFHKCNSNMKNIFNFINNFNLDLVHIHANNYNTIIENYIPDILEITFAKNPIAMGDYKELPHKLDMPNRSKSKEIIIKFEQ